MDMTVVKGYQKFKMMYAKKEYIPGVFFFDSTISGISFPKGVLGYDTTNNKMYFGDGTGGPVLITSA